MEPRDYLAQSKVQVDLSLVRDCQRQLWGVLEDSRHRSLPAIPSAMDRYYKFPVPKLSADGSCSLHGELERQPYDLAAALGGRDPRMTAVLLTLDSFLDFIAKKVAAGWLGVYQARTRDGAPVLVKLASKGPPSRAEFPLTEAFAAKSNNVAVARTGTAVVVHDVKAHRAAGGAYYECSPRTQSEVCLPIFDRGGVVGVIDAEHDAAGHFTPERQAWLVGLALELPSVLPTGGLVVPKS